jgi:hypothetical protein
MPGVAQIFDLDGDSILPIRIRDSIQLKDSVERPRRCARRTSAE